MRKIIKRKIHISTHKRDLIDFINDEFYSHDKHNAFLEFTMKSLPTDNIIVLFYFQKTKRYVETKAFVDGDKFTIEFDTSLINTDETVLGFIYFEKVAQSADVHRFSFGVKVSEIDKLHDIPIEEAKTKRVVAVEDIVTKAELDELFKRIEKNGGTYNDAEIRSSISSISERVQTLEAKPDNDTRYDDSDVKSRLSTLESNSSRYLTKHQPLTSIEERIQQVEARFNNLSNIYLSSHQSLEHLATNDALGKIEQRVEQLEAIDVTNFATKQELDALRNSQPSIENRLTALENKSTVDTTDFAKKSEIPQPYNDSALTERVSLLEAKAIANGAYDDKPLLDKIRAIEEQFRNASNLYLQSHQSLEHLVTKKELEDKHYLTSVPEEYAKKTDLYNDSELRNKITQLETNSVTKEKVESVENRVQVLENKSVVTHEELESAGYAKKTELYNDSELREKITALENNSVTHSELASKNYLAEHQPLTDYATNSKVEAVESRVLALENKPTVVPQGYDDSALSGRVSALEAKEDKDTVYNDEEIKRRISDLEGKTDNFISGVSVNKEGNNVTLTYNYVDGQSKNVSFTDSDTVNIAYDDSGLKARLTNLEERPQIDVSEFAKKTDIPQAYNDSELSRRVSALETKEDKDTIYNDEEIKRRLSNLEGKTDNFISGVSVNKEGNNVTLTYNYVDGQAKNVSFTDSDTINIAYDDSGLKARLTNLENRPQIDVSEFAKKSEVPTAESVMDLTQKFGEHDNKIQILEAKVGYEVHGNGMPNGVVEAPIGTTYVDTAKTNGALKWIKTTDGGNQGWKVIHGDTDWVLGWQEDKGENKNRMYFRRKNDVVHVKFEPKISDSVTTTEVNLILDDGGTSLADTLSIQGFQPVDDILQTIFKKTIYVYDELYNAENSESSQGTGAVILHYLYNNGNSKSGLELLIATSQLGADNSHVNPFSYLTEDEWPTEFPTL